jgi:NitT/TauT family transport system substrate-binding protein
LEQVELTVEDVERVRVRLDAHEEEYQRGQVDAVVTFEPHCQRLASAGAHVLFDSSRLPGEILDVLAVRKSYLEAHPERIDALLRGWFAALDYQRAHPDEAVRRMAPRLGLEARQFRETQAGVHTLEPLEQREMLVGKPPRLLKDIQRLGERMVKARLLPSPPREEAHLIDASSFLRVMR